MLVQRIADGFEPKACHGLTHVFSIPPGNRMSYAFLFFLVQLGEGVGIKFASGPEGVIPFSFA